MSSSGIDKLRPFMPAQFQAPEDEREQAIELSKSLFSAESIALCVALPSLALSLALYGAWELYTLWVKGALY